MARGGKVGGRRKPRKRTRSKCRDSDESDEDFVISEEEEALFEGSEDYSASDGDASEESFSVIGEEEEEEIKQWRKPNKSRRENGVSHQTKVGFRTSRKQGRNAFQGLIEGKDAGDDSDEDEDNDYEEENRVSHQTKVGFRTSRKQGRSAFRGLIEGKDAGDGSDEDNDYEEEEGDEEENGVSHQTKVGFRTSRKQGRSAFRGLIERKDAGDGSDEDNDYEEEEEDEDFLLDEDDCSDEDDEIWVAKRKNNMKNAKQNLQKKNPGRHKKRKRSMASKQPLRKRRRTNCGLRTNSVHTVQNCRVRSKMISRRKKSSLASSDSDFAFSESSDYEYTISEEEREQVREAKELCENLRKNLRSSSLPSNINESGHKLQQRKLPARKSKEKMTETFCRKGKEKLDELKTEVGKQVCGICLSEEDRRRVRGNLNCCTHYFCFACIMEWAKVESRCPLCKQRFQTITKPARSTTGVDLREVAIQVPERDQVYQPSEEELRSYVDPYECVICSECHEAGDDGLMLLCDICDTPAHTFCVGLGREVPQGDWFCFGCRPAQNARLGSSSSSQTEERVRDQRMTNQTAHTQQSPLVNAREGIDLNLLSPPPLSLSQGFSNLSSPRLATRGIQGPSPMSGGGAPTLSGRRWIHRQIQQLLSMDRMNSTVTRMDGLVNANTAGDNLYVPQINRHPTMVQSTRSQDMGTTFRLLPCERLQNDNNSPLERTGDSCLTRACNIGSQGLQDSVAVTNGSLYDPLWPGLLGMPIVSNEEVHRFNGRSNVGIDGIASPNADAEDNNFHLVQSLVNSHLKKLSHDAGLCQSTLNEITRSCTHTLLAACGLEHKRCEVCAVPAPSVCSHIEYTVGGPTSLVKGCCFSCFDDYVLDVVQRVMDTRTSEWLRLGL